ncbi:phosphate carrier protein, mitochondrial-like, partial [Plectropomus leopardus]|uniref:phosphate carrier protein, mitochondrial-like n=1 Tax=Plectropomus leopardus TaxID=160734 RepID=UPI001C4D56BD
MRQIPYTMMKFACFERTVEMLYKYVVPKPRSECSKPEQLVVTFVAGYIAGVFCAIVSHPADSVVSVLNKESGSTAFQVLKRLGPKGLYQHQFSSNSSSIPVQHQALINTLLRSTSGGRCALSTAPQQLSGCTVG